MNYFVSYLWYNVDISIWFECVHALSYACVTLLLIGRPRSNYMEVLQQDINMDMRGILIDWLIAVRMSLKFMHELFDYVFKPISNHSLESNCTTQLHIILCQCYILHLRIHYIFVHALFLLSKYCSNLMPRKQRNCMQRLNKMLEGEPWRSGKAVAF
jgi:TctA family transporter